MSSIAGNLERPIFRPLGGLFLSLFFHGALAVIFIGWLTTTLPKTGGVTTSNIIAIRGLSA